MRLIPLIEAITEALNQERNLLSEVSDGIYSQPGTGAFQSSIGSHIRHSLDHFTSFFAGLEIGEIDYESRCRNDGIARSVDYALVDIEGHIVSLKKLSSEEDRPVRVREESEHNSEEGLNWLNSSLGRELQFLLGHTVHHHAIIAFLLTEHGVDLPIGFGVAPSTQRYERRDGTAC